jgi:2-alkyl-3-oxoalkanoate reductase
MRVFLAGGSGAVGKRLVPLLVAGGHHVVATTRSAEKKNEIRTVGGEPVVLDALDRVAVMKAVASARPDVVVHQMTAISKIRSFRRFDEEFALTNRLRTEGTEYLLDAARAAGVRRFVSQSYTGLPNIREGGPVKTEEDPLDPDPPQSMRRTFDAIRQLETSVMSARSLEGIVLRYGSFYGPGTSISPGGDFMELVRQRKFPIFGNGGGVWSFVHIDDVAHATRCAIEGGRAGIYNIVDDEPAAVSVWLPELARAIGARPPYRLPAWVGRLLIGEAGMSIMTQVRGSSNAKAKRLLNWKPVYSTWRDGFHRMLAPEDMESSWASARLRA